MDKDTGMKFWLIRNSWGPAWASGGVARIKRGVDFLGVENDVWAMCPDGALTCGEICARPCKDYSPRMPTRR